MTKIGLLSDTHTHVDDKLFDFFKDVDEIWHAGDVGCEEVIEQLRKFKPLKGVYGNIDDYKVRSIFPEHLRFKCEDVDVWITHIGGYPDNYDYKVQPEIFDNPPDLFITGHSHILKVINDKKLNLLHINPGAYGKSGLHPVRTALRFKVNGSKILELEVLEIVRK